MVQNVIVMNSSNYNKQNSNGNSFIYKFPREINFNPTYRRIKGTDDYSNKNNQSPSWCDRIMVKTERDIQFLYYDSLKEVKHR